MEGGMEYRTMSSASASAAATINLAPRSAHAGRHPRRDHRRRRRSVVAPARNQRVRSLDDDGGALLNDGASVQVFVKGALPFSVAGCKMSEEINFADHLCRCVLVDGLPKRCRASPVKNLNTPERRTGNPSCERLRRNSFFDTQRTGGSGAACPNNSRGLKVGAPPGVNLKRSETAFVLSCKCSQKYRVVLFVER